MSDRSDETGVLLGLGILALMAWAWTMSNPELAAKVWAFIKTMA